MPIELRIGQSVDRYRILRVLGRGGGGSVYLAEGAPGEEKVALKVMHDHDLAGVARKRFEREAEFVMKLRHPHIVRLVDFGYTREHGLPYICFAHLEGLTVKEALRRDGPFTLSRIVRVTEQTLDALEEAHRHGVIHRDIKPANIFLEERAGNESVQVLDFGLAKALEGELLETTGLTRTGYRLGTPRYMSPEMARGAAVVEASDLYSLGLVVAEMISGEPVVTDDLHVAIMLEHAKDEPLPLSPAVTGSPLAPIVRHALAKRVDRRYRGAVEMRAALREVARRPSPLPLAEEPDAPTIQMSRPPADISIGSLDTAKIRRPRPPRHEEAPPAARNPAMPDETRTVEIEGDAPTHAWRRPAAPIRLEPPPELALWVAVAVGVLLAVVAFVLVVALVV
ncbi:MAG: serine/threonine-protein kinase [Myxococcota bacterium]